APRPGHPANASAALASCWELRVASVRKLSVDREGQAAVVLAPVGETETEGLAGPAQERAGHPLAHRVRHVEEVVVVVDRRHFVAALVEEAAADRLRVRLVGRDQVPELVARE